jgi:hypothetical protein
LNTALLVRRVYDMPIETFLVQRSKNRTSIDESLKQTNKFMELPSLDELDNHIEELYQDGQWVPYIINWLLRHHYVRNQDLLFDFVTTQKETKDTSKNYMLFERKHQRLTYIRNKYKTASKYGQKTVVIDTERFIMAIKKANAMGKFPLARDETTIGYYVQMHSFRKLGEGVIMKMVVNHHKHDINELKRISQSRGTDLPVLLTNYNIVYT